MKLVTFNIRCDYRQDGDNCFSHRKDLIREKILKEQPDVACFQEVLPHVAAWLKENLEGYYVVGCGRDENLRDEQEAVAYRKDRLNLVSMDTFWLSGQPYEPGSRYEKAGQSICPRACTEVVFELFARGGIQEKGTLFRLFNIHLDHEGPEARRLGIGQILKKAEAGPGFPHIPVILAGDFNAPFDSPELKELNKREDLQNITQHVGITYHGYQADSPVGIDHIYVQKPLICKKVEKWEDEKGGVWLSDHYPVCAQLEAGEER